MYCTHVHVFTDAVDMDAHAAVQTEGVPGAGHEDVYDETVDCHTTG